MSYQYERIADSAFEATSCKSALNESDQSVSGAASIVEVGANLDSSWTPKASLGEASEGEQVRRECPEDAA